MKNKDFRRVCQVVFGTGAMAYPPEPVRQAATRRQVQDCFENSSSLPPSGGAHIPQSQTFTSVRPPAFLDCLKVFNHAVKSRDDWYNKGKGIEENPRKGRD